MLKNINDAIINTEEGVLNCEGNISTNKILYSRWENRYSKTIKDFYEDFIYPRSPDDDILKKWNELLSWYIDQPEAIYFLRGGSTNGRNLLCRRGWMCVQESSSGEKLRYIYADNSLASYIYKMVLDGFCPDKTEFMSFMTDFQDLKSIKWIRKPHYKKVVTTRKYLSFPCCYSGNELYEYDKTVMLLSEITPKCCIGKYNYKHSHIFDVNDFLYYVKGTAISSKDMKKKYFSITAGDDKKYKLDVTTGIYYYNRNKILDSEFNLVKEFLKAHTMRFLNPLNHFLAPHDKCNKFTKDDGTFALDIAEYDKLLNYIKFKRSNQYGQVYKNFVDSIKVKCDVPIDNGDDIIDIVYHEKSLADNTIFTGYCSPKGYNKKHNKKRIIKSIIPNDVNSFIDNLNKTHVIKEEIIYLDGTSNTKIWRANNITTANLWGNINSRIGHRKDRGKIAKAVYKA